MRSGGCVASMRIHFSTRYEKEYRRLAAKVQQQADDRIRLFLSHPFHPLLNNHPLGGKFQGCRSINVTGDYRALFEARGEIQLFIRIGTHPQLYG